MSEKENLAFTNAKLVLDCVDNGRDFDEVRKYVVDDAPFECQADAMKGIDTIEAYGKWMTGFGTTTAPGFTAQVHSRTWDDETKMAVYFGTFHAKHTGEGGPVPPTNKEMHTDYVYFLEMNDDNKAVKMQKVWNDGFAFKQVGWA